MTSDLQQQFDFLSEIERLRQVDRQTLLLDGSRPENSAEHSWHLALYALVFAPYAPAGVSIPRVIQMLLLHDIVEIDVGDHPIDEPTNWTAVAEAEDRAQKRIFGLLPDVQGQALQALWQEFEAAETVDAHFAKALDYCQPIFQTLCAVSPPVDHMRVVKENLTTGRATTDINLRSSEPAHTLPSPTRRAWLKPNGYGHRTPPPCIHLCSKPNHHSPTWRSEPYAPHRWAE